mgnify:FL=1
MILTWLNSLFKNKYTKINLIIGKVFLSKNTPQNYSFILIPPTILESKIKAKYEFGLKLFTHF